LNIRPETAAFFGAFVPIQAEPFKACINFLKRSFLKTAPVGVFNPKNEYAFMTAGEKIIEERRSRAAHM
jgi:hypothetical protein